MTNTQNSEPKIPHWKRTHYSLRFAGVQLVAAYSFLALTTAVYLYWHQAFTGVHANSSLSSSSSSSTLTFDRLTQALRMNVFPLASLFTSYLTIMLTRAANPTARNPLGTAEVAVHGLQNRILLNSIEQLPFFSLNVLILAVDSAISDHLFSLLLVLVTFFYTFGRATFHLGYSLHPKWRTFGFAVSFSPVSCLFIYNLLRVCGVI